MDYYIYIYLDPRKPGNYLIDNKNLGFKPFYVGMGKNNRDKFHLREARNYKNWKCYSNRKINFYKINIINSIYGEKLRPIIIRIKEGLSKKAAMAEEKNIISILGRKFSDKNGILSNISEGGSISHRSKNGLEKYKEKISKKWIIITPEGEKKYIQNLSEFCKNNSLSRSAMVRIAQNKRIQHKGYKCLYI